MGFVRQALQIAHHVAIGHIAARRSEGQRLRLFDQALLHRCRQHGARRGRQWRGTAAHHRAQHAGLGVVAEQRLGQLRLHAEHVDQEVERAEVAGEAVEHAGLADALRVDVGRGQSIDLVAHAQQRRRCVVHAQHRENAAHRRQLVRHRDQHVAIFGFAEVLVDELLGLRQRGPQFLHHAAHRLAIGNAAVQLFHPAFQRLGRLALAHGGEPLGEPRHAAGLIGVVEVGVFEGGFDVEQARGDLHRQRSGRRGAALLRLRHCRLKFGGERVAEREQALERIANERELLRQAGQTVHFAPGNGRPGFLRSRHALARLCDDGRVEAAEHAHRIVHRLVMRQAVNLAHSSQARRLAPVARRLALRTEKQQVLSESLRHVGAPPLKDAELCQQPRRHSLAEHVEAEQPVRLRLEHRRGQRPQRAHRTLWRARPQAGTNVTHARCCLRRSLVAHQIQQLSFEPAAAVDIRVARCDAGIGGHRAPLPVERPQIGRMHAVGACCLLDCAVLREQRQGRYRLACEQACDEVEQGERSALDVFDHRQAELVRPARVAVHGGFAGAQHRGHGRQADEFKRTHALVDLRARGPQHDRIDSVEVGRTERLGLLDKAPQRLVRSVEGTAQFLVHPRQGAEVVAASDQRACAACCAQVCAHALVTRS